MAYMKKLERGAESGMNFDDSTENFGELSLVYLDHKKKLQSCEGEILQWEKFINDYESLQEKLKTYPDKASYEVMVPIGSLAYMKGKAIHTNEILVHLGESWFAERSCKDANEIIERRKKVCEENLKKVKKISQTHKSWLSQTEQMATEDKNLANIVEHVTEEEYLIMKEKHTNRVAQQIAESQLVERAAEESAALSSTLKEETEHLEKFLRLDALEEQERLQGELNSSDSEDSGAASDSESKQSPLKMRGKQKLSRRVSWADQLSEATQDDIDVVPTPIRLKYRSRQKSLPSDLGEDNPVDLNLDLGAKDTPVCAETSEEGESEAATPADGLSPQSPSDLYKMISALTVSVDEPPPKSILKKKSDSQGLTMKKVELTTDSKPFHYVPMSPDEHLIPENPPLSESPREIKKLKPAFSYKVVARDDYDVEIEKEPEESEEPKKMSRFKASRMKNPDSN